MFRDYTPSTTNPAGQRGKGKDDSQWRLGWWDFHPLSEPSTTPLQWSGGAIIFTAHPTLPLVQAQISAGRQLHLDNPLQMKSLPNSYKPPTIICACPDNIWLFAYFPAVDEAPPLGVLWRRASKADEWYIRESWPFDPSACPVTARWFGTDREWVVDPTGSLCRLPRFGPHNPLNSPTLLLVTQSHHLSVYWLGSQKSSIRTVSCLLTSADAVTEESPSKSLNDVSYGPGAVRVCTKACIGMRYDDATILVATHSSRLPCLVDRTKDVDPTLRISPHLVATESDPSTRWDSWGRESTIELCAVELKGIHGRSLSLSSQPLPAINLFKNTLAHMSFMCKAPVMHHVSQDGVDAKGQAFLCASVLNLPDYESTPSSQLILYSLSDSADPNTWTVRHEATRSYPSRVVSFFHAIKEPLNPAKLCLFAGVLQTSGGSRRRASELTIGHVTALRIPDLSDDDDWQPSPIVCPAGSAWRDLPLTTAVSPNHVLVCTASSFMLSSPVAIHPLPRRHGNPSEPQLSPILAAAICGRKSVTDLSSLLSVPSVPLEHVSETLYRALVILHAGDNKSPDRWAWEILGVAVEIYGMRLHRLKDTGSSALLTVKRQNAHDLCSLAACNMAFRACRIGDGYDLAGVWQLIAICTWIVSFLESLVKECVTSHANNTATPPRVKVEEREDLFGSASPSPGPTTSAWESPALLHLVQPYALGCLCQALKHVVLLYDGLKVKRAKEENTQMAKDVFLDLVERSGINLKGLASLLLESLQESKSISEEDALRSLSLCQPTPAMIPLLQKTAKRIATSDVLNKAVLFIKPSDLVGVGGGSLIPEQDVKERERDVITKAILLKNGPIFRCRRCDGQSEVGANVSVAGRLSLHWQTWERMWARRCLCGGVWYISSISSK